MLLWLLAGAAGLYFFAALGRKAKQQRALAGLRSRFPGAAQVDLPALVPELAGQITNEEYATVFEWIYGELLRRSGARNFAELMRKAVVAPTQMDDLSFNVCADAVGQLPQRARQLIGERTSLAGIAIGNAVRRAGEATQAELDGIPS